MSDPLRAKALQYLARREYSRAELAQKLAQFTEDAGALEALLADFTTQNLLSDRRYAASRVGARAQRYGRLRLKQELEAAGVAADIIAAVLPAPETEAAQCRTVWTRKFGVLPASVKERAKQLNFLRYRGFSAEAIRRVLHSGNEGDDA
ncbi:MAG: recombination regulator RecX [Zoogloeaceae bacterium]|jgi:regulatory protein|nr:recombination regulator RecX [Zoogloeaceae bacterium]